MNDEKKDIYIHETPMTYDEYAELPDDGNRYELVEGYLELLSAPNVVHQVIALEMAGVLKETCNSDYLIMIAPLDVILSPKETRQPDLIAVHRSRMHIVTKRGIEGPPDLVVEILSPSTQKRDKIGKAKTYARYGIPEYWIVDPESGVLEQYILTGSSYELIDVYLGDEPIRSQRMSCASFTMERIMKAVPDLDF